VSDPEAGWHADPAGTAGTYRWWDGQAWTRWLSHDQGAPAPDAAEAPSAEPAVLAQPAAAPASAPEAPAEQPVRLPVAIAVVVAALVVAVVAVGGVVAASAERLPSGPALAPPARSSSGAVGYNRGTRAVAIGQLKVTLPGSPYLCDSSVGSAPPTFASGVACSAAVHENYDTQGNDWAATVVVGVLPPAFVDAADLKATATKAFGSARGQFFSGDKTTVTEATAEPTELGAGTRAMVVSGEVHYRVPHVASRYDRMLVLVVALPDGTHVVVASSRPDDSGAAMKRALQASLDTITVK
jgi:hypothetical protein